MKISPWRLQETAELIRDGYCHTGDRGYYDTEGNVFIIGRYKELLKYRMAHVISPLPLV
jgi:long-subunit acyl-CoA synthetase (AMP-forming)